MQIIIDFALSESREALDNVLLNLKKAVEFELHDAIAVHENRLSDEHGGSDVAICDVDVMVNQLLEMMNNRLRNILNYPHRFTVREDTTHVTDLISDAFETAATSLYTVQQNQSTEMYVAVCIEGQSASATDTVTWGEVLEKPTIDKVSELYKQAEQKVLAICRRELIYLGEKYGKSAL